MISQSIIECFAQECRERGLDLLHAFGAHRQRKELRDLGVSLPACENPAAVLVANTKSMWCEFQAALADRPELRQSDNPLDCWVEGVVSAAADATRAGYSILWAHRPVQGRFAPLQRWAADAGFAVMAPCHLLNHPTHGLWIGLRALVVLDTEFEGVVSAARNLCEGCEAPCLGPFRRAADARNQYHGTAQVTELWRDWLAVRDACPMCPGSRYSNEQVRYHYQRDRSVLAR